MNEPTPDGLRCTRCGDLPEPLICLGHNPDGSQRGDVPAALAELGRAADTVLTDTQTAALLRAMATDPVLRARNEDDDR